MKDVFLCGHTGSDNRGCEAIIKGTAAILEPFGIKPILATKGEAQDKRAGIEVFKEVIPYFSLHNKPIRLRIGQVVNRITKTPFGTEWFHQRPIWKRLKGNVSMNVGGDTYCYDLPRSSLALNWYTAKKNIPNVLWACSIEDTAITNTIYHDLNRYDLIMPRETLTYENLMNAGIDASKLLLCADPAFCLPLQEAEIDPAFFDKPVVGINLSPLVMDSCDQPGLVMENYIQMIEYIFDQTDYKVCLIPHVYSDESPQDLIPLTALYERFKDTGRVLLIDQPFNCEQIKTVISRCTMTICARTHASIAAYSTFVPTLVIGYSVKSKGIAQDLFGEYEGYVIPAQQVQESGQLVEGFKWLDSNKKKIKAHLIKVMETYQQKAKAAGAVILRYAEENN